MRKLHAFTLTELLVVLIMIGILVLLAVPNLMPLISRARSVEAKEQLGYMHLCQRTHFFTYSRYSDNFEDLGFIQEPLVTQNGTANYVIEVIEATNNTFKARATSITDFDGDGIFNVWEIDQDRILKEVTKD